MGELEPRQHTFDRLETALQTEAEHAAVAAHLTDRDLVTGVGRQSRIVDDRDDRLFLEPPGDAQRALVLTADAQGQRLHAADEEVGDHRVEEEPTICR